MIASYNFLKPTFVSLKCVSALTTRASLFSSSSMTSALTFLKISSKNGERIVKHHAQNYKVGVCKVMNTFFFLRILVGLMEGDILGRI